MQVARASTLFSSLTGAIIIACIGVSLVGFVSSYLTPFGMHPLFLLAGNYAYFGVQLALYQFIHGGFFHLLGNTIFLILFALPIEARMGHARYALFFLGNTLFVAAALLLTWQPVTVGMSGFGMAALAYTWLLLHKYRDPEAKAVLFFLIINIVIGFTGNISLVGHAAGAVFGMLAFALNEKIWQSKRV